MSVTQYNPWQNSSTMPKDFKQFFERYFNDEDGDQSNVVTSQWAPRVDIREEAKGFVILADIPGVEPKDIEINMDKGILTIRGERRNESSEDGENYTRVERSHGVFYRRFALPDSADAEGIKATGKHGVLEISIPKKPESTPRRISIDAAE
ncbi:MAG: Hsp20/alpha crystallin family protein [Rhodanobacteraceae bacterium]